MCLLLDNLILILIYRFSGLLIHELYPYTSYSYSHNSDARHCRRLHCDTSKVFSLFVDSNEQQQVVSLH